LAKNLFEWLPYVALDQVSQLAFGAHNFFEMLEVACRHVYSTHKRTNRGELGEILLHIACVEHFSTFPILCKLTLKTASNDTAKGFDGIYVVPKQNDFEIWLGESKFYRQANRAIKDAVKSITEHILPDFITAEKAMITAHVDDKAPFFSDIKKILRQKTSADVLLKKAVFPVLIAYNSRACASHTDLTKEYVQELTRETKRLHDLFAKRAESLKLQFRLIFAPLSTKKTVVDNFDSLLRPYL
ncbi:MAG: DUF1837 domain-containing protein, partial [Xanthobacteraceae bacterium]